MYIRWEEMEGQGTEETTTDMGPVTGFEMEVYFNLPDGVSMKMEKVGRVDYITLGGSVSLKVLLNRWLALW